jgi:predicted esterase
MGLAFVGDLLTKPSASPSMARMRVPIRVPARRAVLVLAGVALAGTYFARCGPRPRFLPLATSIDGPPPARAAGVLVFLHGLGGSIARVERIVKELRDDGLPSDVAIVVVEGPFSTGFGHSWGNTPEEQATSRARLRLRLHELLGESGPPPSRIVIAGFSQGAGVAIDTAVEEPRIGALASFSPCLSWLRGELPKRDDLRVLLAHGTRDARCSVEESRSLARVLDAAHKPAPYIEFDGEHTVPPEVVRALAAFATAP